jgi:hypothetical protein
MTILSIFLIAFATGATAGLSTSPVAPALVTGLGVIVFAALGINGLTVGPASKLIGTEEGYLRPLITPPVLASLGLGLISGIPIGILIRTHHWLAPSPQAIVARYRLGDVKDGEVVRALMHAELGPVVNSEGKVTGGSTSGPGLFASELHQETCTGLTQKRIAHSLTKEDFLQSKYRGFRHLGELLNFDRLDQKAMGELVAAFCGEPGQ